MKIKLIIKGIAGSQRFRYKVLFYIYVTILLFGSLMALNEELYDEPQRWEINIIGFIIMFIAWFLLKRCAVRAFDPDEI